MVWSSEEDSSCRGREDRDSSLISTVRPQSLVPTALRGNAVFDASHRPTGGECGGRRASQTAFPRGALVFTQPFVQFAQGARSIRLSEPLTVIRSTQAQ